MRFPSHLLQTATFRSEPLLAAMAAIAVGMFVGTWIIGPAVTRDSASPLIVPPVTLIAGSAAIADISVAIFGSTPATDESVPFFIRICPLEATA